MKIAIIDYGMGNLHSVLKSVQVACQDIAGVNTFLTACPDEVFYADKVIFPGQGAMRDCMHALNTSGLRDAISDALKRKPFFGICVGAQLLFDMSEEGSTQGLGFFSGSVRRFAQPLYDEYGVRLKVPHMGWNIVHQEQSHPLFNRVEQNAYFYFVHSYYFAPQNKEITLATSEYPNSFSCIVGQSNVFATQFHTEKSHNNGLQLLKNFALWSGNVP